MSRVYGRSKDSHKNVTRHRGLCKPCPEINSSYGIPSAMIRETASVFQCTLLPRTSPRLVVRMTSRLVGFSRV